MKTRHRLDCYGVQNLDTIHPCRRCGTRPRVIHVLAGYQRGPRQGTHPEVFCPKCWNTYCQCDQDGEYIPCPFQAWQIVGRWNRRQPNSRGMHICLGRFNRDYAMTWAEIDADIAEEEQE
jgi:hypothetical protein